MILIGLKIILCALGAVHFVNIGVEWERDGKHFTVARVVGFLNALVCVLTGAFI